MSDEAAVEMAESADAFLRSLLLGCKCGHGWHEGKCDERECHCSVFMAVASSGPSKAPAKSEDIDVWCPECSLNFVLGQTVQDYSCPNCHAALLPRV